MIHDPREEILERMWTLREEGKGSIPDIERLLPEMNVAEELVDIERSGHITRRDDVVSFTPRGEELACLVIRRHRLAERLLVDVFDVRGDAMEEGACAFEHALSSEVTASVCTFLGHPPLCPHNKPIPQGDCCTTPAREMRPVVTPLTELEIGRSGRIVFIAPKFIDRLDRLAGLGVIPGSIVRLRQRRPAAVIEIGETSLAIDLEIAREIYVKRVEEASA